VPAIQARFASNIAEQRTKAKLRAEIARGRQDAFHPAERLDYAGIGEVG
jgi:hypothetical protein